MPVLTNLHANLITIGENEFIIPSGSSLFIPYSRYIALQNEILALEADLSVSIGNTYVDRGNAVAPDWQLGDLVVDFAWHDLDCSAIVPLGATTAVFQMRILSNESNKNFFIKTKGYTGDFNLVVANTKGQFILEIAEGPIALGVDRIVEYMGTPPGLIVIVLTIRGWFI